MEIINLNLNFDGADIFEMATHFFFLLNIFMILYEIHHLKFVVNCKWVKIRNVGIKMDLAAFTIIFTHLILFCFDLILLLLNIKPITKHIKFYQYLSFMSWAMVPDNTQRYYFHLALLIYCVLMDALALVVTAQS